MIRVDCVQGSEEWHRHRMGRPTASQFSRIIQPKNRKPSASQHKYKCELVAERLLQTPLVSEATAFMERGKAMEDEAVAYYELQRGVDTERLGFALTDDRRAGCSPDRLVGADGLLQIKCPSPGVHVGYLLGDVAEDYMAQVQGELWVTGRAWADVLSYSPLMPPALVRVDRDEAYIRDLSALVLAFSDDVDEAEARLGAIASEARSA